MARLLDDTNILSAMCMRKVFTLSILLSVGFSVQAADTVSSKVTLFFTGYVRGNYGPCGCSAGPSGGVSRRAGYAQAFENENPGPVLHVDAGNYLQPPGPRSEMINKLMVESMKDLPLRVLNLATEDLFWWKQLSQMQPETTEIISTNLVPERPDLPSPKKFAVLQVPDGRTALEKNLRIGFLGISDPARVKPNSGFRGIDPLVAVAEIKDQVLAKADFLVVLADIRRMSREIAGDSLVRRLAETHREIAAIILTERRFVVFDPVQVNSTVILSSVERGRYLGRLTFILSESGSVQAVEPEFIELKEGVPEIPSMQAKGEWINSVLP